MKFKILTVFIILAGIGFSFVSAQEPIVQCELGNSGTACDLCQFFELIGRVINFLLFYALPPLAVVAFLAAGILFLFSGDDPNKRTKGRKVLWVTVSGILIAFAGWLIINTILDQLVNKNAGIIWMPWNEIPRCELEEGMEGPPAQIKPECGNGLDDDGDGKTDFGEDPDCSSENDNSEKATPPIGTLPKCNANGESALISNIINCMVSRGFAEPVINQRYGGSHTCNLPPEEISVSCHYGGKNTDAGCNGTSHAVDFGKNQNAAKGKTLKQTYDTLSGTCNNGVAGVYYEDAKGNRYASDNATVNHIHINDTDASGCGCR